MSKHTPGPWAILPEEVDRAYIRIRGTQLGGRYKIANALTPFYDNVHEREAEETRANANLIASAPEMYEALGMIIRAFDPYKMGADSHNNHGVALAAARKALSKAEGRKE